MPKNIFLKSFKYVLNALAQYETRLFDITPTNYVVNEEGSTQFD